MFGCPRIAERGVKENKSRIEITLKAFLREKGLSNTCVTSENKPSQTPF